VTKKAPKAQVPQDSRKSSRLQSRTSRAQSNRQDAAYFMSDEQLLEFDSELADSDVGSTNG
jgi:hypothetical protein